MPAFGVGGGDGVEGFATRFQARLSAVIGQGACGWVIDLRGNVGGNMWPMLLAIGPLLGDGPAGSFVGRDTVITWGYTEAVAWYGADTLARLSSPLPLPRLPAVAVLTGPLTASSGEAIAIAFRGRPGARSFGLPTGGLSTANQGFPLPDGSKLVLTTAIDADRTGRRYGAAVEPDEDRALAWLAMQPCEGAP